MTEAPRTIILHGRLGEKFGRVHRFVCPSVGGAVRALCMMVPGFEAELMSSQDAGVAYVCLAGRKRVPVELVHAPIGDDIVRIVPVLRGAGGRGGVLSAVLGVVLIAAAFVTGGASLSASGLVFSGLAGQMAFGLGVAFAVSGISQMLVPMDTTPTAETVENGASYHLDGVKQTVAQGAAVPLLYGEMMIGSAQISAGLYSEDQL